MRRCGVLLASLLVASVLAQGSAAARDIEWCAEDPVFDILGAQFRITTSINSSASAVTHIVYVVEVPSNAGHVTVTIPAAEPLAAVTEVQVNKTGPAYDPEDGSFRVRVAITVSGPEHTTVIAQLDGRSVEPDTSKGHTNKPVKLHFDVTP